MTEITVGSLFSGIGGIDLGLERAGMTVRWQSEIDPYACRVLAKHWPDVPNLGDVASIEWSTVERVDLICGGYPCQPFSLAGVRRGESDPRHLWPHFATAIRHLRPRWVLLENVPGHLSLGFGRVLGDLAACGYDCEWDCLPAAAVGAPHLRYRVFVVAHARGDTVGDAGWRGSSEPQGSDVPAVARDDGPQESMADTDDAGRSQQRWPGAAPTQHATVERRGDVADAEVVAERTGLCAGRPGRLRWRRPRDGGGPFVVADTGRVRRVRIGRQESRRLQGARRGVAHRRRELRQLLDPPGRHDWAVEPGVGRVAHGIPDRLDRLRCLGNAVVPQVAEWVGRRIMESA